MKPVQVERFYLGCLAHASYMIGSEGVAAVVDPQRDVDIYLEAAANHGWKIEYIIETPYTPTSSPAIANWPNAPELTSISARGQELSSRTAPCATATRSSLGSAECGPSRLRDIHSRVFVF